MAMARLHGMVAALVLALLVLDMAGAAVVYQPVAVAAPHHHVELRSVNAQVQPEGGYLLQALYPARAPESSHVRVVRSPTKYKYGGGGYGYPSYGGYGGGCNTCGGGYGYPSYGGSYSQSSSQASSQSSSGSFGGWGRRR